MKIYNSNVKYNIDRTNKVVVAYCSVSVYEMFANVRLEGLDSFVKGFLFRYPDYYWLRGVARCSDEDEFDEAYGMKLAELRLKMKVREKRSKILCDMNEFFSDCSHKVCKVLYYDADREDELDAEIRSLLREKQ